MERGGPAEILHVNEGCRSPGGGGGVTGVPFPTESNFCRRLSGERSGRGRHSRGAYDVEGSEKRQSDVIGNDIIFIRGHLYRVGCMARECCGGTPPNSPG